MDRDSAARVGLRAWFIGNLYEALVGMPQLLVAARGRRRGLLAVGSPVRFYAPLAPLAFGATALALARSWRTGGDRRAITATALSLASAAALSGYLIRSVNVRLLASDEPLGDRERRRMVATWHAVNGVRLCVLATAMGSLSRASRHGSGRDVVTTR